MDSVTAQAQQQAAATAVHLIGPGGAAGVGGAEYASQLAAASYQQQLLGGGGGGGAPDAMSALQQRCTALESVVAQLQAQMAVVQQTLGVAPQSNSPGSGTVPNRASVSNLLDAQHSALNSIGNGVNSAMGSAALSLGGGLGGPSLGGEDHSLTPAPNPPP